jgi:DNA polymerase III delta prime subunit
MVRALLGLGPLFRPVGKPTVTKSMAYDFTTLSPADFEDLCRDLVGREIGIQFEAFTTGPDGGIDGRHATSAESTILQVKHLVGSSFPKLRSTMKAERSSIDRLAPDRYILATSRGLTPPNKKALAAEIGPALRAQGDIYGAGELNALLRKFPDIEKAHIKLWLSGTAMLERVLRGAAHTFTELTKSEIEAKVKVYAHNPSFPAAQTTLESQHVLIVSGPPGVGKTTLAEMLAYTYLAEGWELVAIRALDDGFGTISDAKKQVFLFDDFLGKIALDEKALAAKDSDLARFMRRVRTSPNARFILTTRAYIFEEARRASEHLSDQRLDVSRYLLDVGVYTRRIRARILYNHLIVAGTPTPLVHALIESGTVKSIVDHRNYNPRVIEWMTDVDRLDGESPEAYPASALGHSLPKTHPREVPTSPAHNVFLLPVRCGTRRASHAVRGASPRLERPIRFAPRPKGFRRSRPHIRGRVHHYQWNQGFLCEPLVSGLYERLCQRRRYSRRMCGGGADGRLGR